MIIKCDPSQRQKHNEGEHLSSNLINIISYGFHIKLISEFKKKLSFSKKI